ncbi:glycosyltransferase family 4 protein [Candidatus Woesearchaeota archaeon]|nr:glycosyltransferase family 4 protein [Candidatus Woesearchaeota archaeon]
MKIIHILDDYSNRSGHSTIYMIEGMKDLGHDVEIYTSDVRLSALPPNDKASKVKITRFRGIKIFKKAFFPGVIFRILFDKNPDIIHTHVIGYFSTFITGYLKRIKKYNLVLWADIDRDVPPHKGVLGKIYYNFFLKWPAKQANIIQVFTEEQKKILMERTNLKPERIFVWPSGVDYHKFQKKYDKQLLRRKLEIPNKFIVINVSSIVRKRRLELSLRAIKDLDVFFVHVGTVVDNEYFKYLNNLIKELKIENKVIFVGQKFFNEIIDYYLCADLFVLTSSNESFGIPILEAMAAGLPVISTNVGAAKELIENGKNGFVINDNEVILTIERIMKMDLKEMGNYSKSKAINYDWKVLIPKLEEMYVKLI